MLKSIACAAAISGLVALGACSDGSSEKAGENIDSAIENATQGHENKGDGAFEKAGESIDKATGAKNNDVIDAIGDKTDGDKTTN